MRLIWIYASLLMASIGVQAQVTGSTVSTPMDDGHPISADFPFEHKYVDVLDSRMAYIEVGEGEPILFLHGNPTSSYLWRNVIPHVQEQGRCIAPDLIGMGSSDKPDIEYSFADHARYLDAFIEALDLSDITLVLHDWGSGLGFHYARRHPDNVKAIVFMEAFVQSWPSYEAMPPQGQMMFRQMRTPEAGWNYVVKQNAFIEQILPMAAGRPLTPEEMQHYRAPFVDEASRKPVWKWPNEVPIGGEPADVARSVEEYGRWLEKSEIQKLMFTVEPGFLLSGERAQWCRDHLKNLTEIRLGPGVHYIQEQYPHTIGQATAKWLREIP